MSNTNPQPRRRWRRLALVLLGLLAFSVAMIFGTIALETYAISQKIHLLVSAQNLRAGMTRTEVEKILGTVPGQEPKELVADEKGIVTISLTPHDEIKADLQLTDGKGSKTVRYTAWYCGVTVTSQHHVRVIYDGDGKVTSVWVSGNDWRQIHP